MEEEEEGQPSLEQRATSVTAGEEEEGEFGGGTAAFHLRKYFTHKEEGDKREKCGIIELVGGVYTVYNGNSL